MSTTHSTLSTLGRRTFLAGAVAAAGLCASSHAQADGSDLVSLQVIDRETGRSAPVWRHAGRLYVAGRPGARYGVRITNNSGGRVLVVMSVDGVNVLTGQTAGYDQKGYILRPYVSADVNGWRKSDTQVAAFTFAPLSNSYAARTGRPGDVGVIGIAVFTERSRESIAIGPAMPEYRGRAANAYPEEAQARVQSAPPPVVAPAAPSARRAAPESAQTSERLGTGHGAREWSTARTVAFERASAYPQFTSQVEYDSYENLVARGVIPRYRPAPPSRPRPFPTEPGYVPDPPRGY